MIVYHMIYYAMNYDTDLVLNITIVIVIAFRLVLACVIVFRLVLLLIALTCFNVVGL